MLGLSRPVYQPSGEAPVNLDADAHMLAFGGLIDILVMNPTPAMTSDLMTKFDERIGDVGVALEGHRNSENG